MWNCEGCWNYSNCEKKDNKDLAYCAKKGFTCRYCNEKDCKVRDDNARILCITADNAKFMGKVRYMRLSEIAEYVVDNNPDCCVKNEVIRGCRTESYEESLIEPLLNFYMYEKMDLCGCGIPENTYEAIRRYLRIRKSCFEENLSWEDVTERYRTNLHIDYDDSMNYGILQFLAYILDSYGFTEHGSSVGGCWLTREGEKLLVVLDAWHDLEEEIR